MCLADCPSESSFETLTSDHPVSLILGVHVVGVLLLFESTNGASSNSPRF